MLSDLLTLAAAMVLIIMGLQSFMDPERRKVSSEVIKSTLMMVLGLFLMYTWYRGVSVSTKGGNY